MIKALFDKQIKFWIRQIFAADPTGPTRLYIQVGWDTFSVVLELLEPRPRMLTWNITRKGLLA